MVDLYMNYYTQRNGLRSEIVMINEYIRVILMY